MRNIAAMIGKELKSFDSLPLVSVDGEEDVGVFMFEPRTVKHPEVVVFSHGLGCDAYYPLFALICQALQLGYKVLAFDLPGHGIQSRHRLDREGLGSVLEAAMTAGGVISGPWIGVSYSMGTWAFALASPEVKKLCKGFFLVGPAWKTQFVLSILVNEARFFFTRGFWTVFKELGLKQMWPAVGALRRKRFPLRLNSETFPYPQGVVRFINKLSENSDASSMVSPDAERWIYEGRHDRIVFPRDAFASSITTKHVLLKETHWTLPFASSLRKDFGDFLSLAIKR